MEQLRRVLVYELFINHYLKMAREATPFKSFNQALIYLKQASRLCSLLTEDDRVEQADNYLHVIETLHEVVLNERHRDSQTKPQLPQRESVRDQGNTHRVNRVRQQRPIPSGYDPYKNCPSQQTTSVPTKSTKTEKTPPVETQKPPPRQVHPAVEQIVANQRQIQCEVHTKPNLPSDSDVLKVIPVPRTPVQPLRAVRFIQNSVDGYTSDDTDSVISSMVTIKEAMTNGMKQRTISTSSDDVFTAF